MSPWESLGISLVLFSVYAFGICVGVKIEKESDPEGAVCKYALPDESHIKNSCVFDYEGGEMVCLN